MAEKMREEQAIAALQKLADRWPSTLWLFSADGQLCVMRKNADGSRRLCADGISVDPDAEVETIQGIDNDGGDW